MRKLLFLAVLAVALFMVLVPVSAQDSSSSTVTPTAEAEKVPALVKSGIGHLVWEFANSAVGVTVIGSVLGFLLLRLFTAVPVAGQVFSSHKGLLFDAIRHAEAAIPNDSPNRAAQRMDAALRFVLQFEPTLSKVATADMRAAIDQAHAAVEEKKAA